MSNSTGTLPEAFANAAAQLRAASFRAELDVEEIAAPERIAPHAIAFACGVRRSATEHPAGGHGDIDSPYGAGRLVLMYDPESEHDWGAPFRLVTYAQAPLEPEIAVDPFIAQVAWSWLTDALETGKAEYTYLSGTSTKTLSSGFGTLESHGESAQIELRASWTPLGENFSSHASAWSELVCLLAGLTHDEGLGAVGAQRLRSLVINE